MTEKEIYKEIIRYIEDDLSMEEIENLWEIFVEHPETYKLFETELHLRDLAKEANQNKIHSIDGLSVSAESRQLYSAKSWILAAAAVLLIGFGFQQFFAGETDLSHPYAISYIDINEMAGSDILRSEQEITYVMDVEINRALAMSYEGESEKAAEKFKRLLVQEPDPEQKARIDMNLGILYYNRADYNQAKSYFEPAARADRMNRFFKEKAWWFLGNTYLNLEMMEEAREAVHNAYISDGRFVDSAQSLLEKLDIELGNEKQIDE